MKSIKILSIVSFILFIFTGNGFTQSQSIKPEILSIQKIWDQAPHNAFTDLIHFNNQWFCVFREGSKHVSDDGALRIIVSNDGENWRSAALITSEDSDLRDAKITLTPNNKLMLSGAEALHNKSRHSHQSLVWFSDDGFNWSKEKEIGDPDFWLWRIVWHKKTAYSFGYECGEHKSLRLYKSRNGKKFKPLVADLKIDGYPNETGLVFKNDTALCLLRRDAEFNSALLGTSVPPYKNWEWKDLGIQIGGPQIVWLNNGNLLAAVRLQKNEKQAKRTALCSIHPDSGEMEELLAFPSGGDTSYPGMVLDGNILWISYYSSHEEKTSIYLAKLAL